MTPTDEAASPTFAGLMVEPIDVLMKVARLMSLPDPDLPALQNMVVSCAQVFVTVRIGVAKLEGATACPAPVPMVPPSWPPQRAAEAEDLAGGVVVMLDRARFARVVGVRP